MRIVEWLFNFEGCSSTNSLNATSDFSMTLNATLAASQLNATQAVKTQAILSNLKSRWILKDKNRTLVAMETGSKRGGDDIGDVDKDEDDDLPLSIAIAVFSLTLHDTSAFVQQYLRNHSIPKDFCVIENLWSELETFLLRDTENLYNNVTSVDEVTPQLLAPILKSVFSQILFVKNVLALRFSCDETTNESPSLADSQMILLSIQKHFDYAQSLVHDLTEILNSAEAARKGERVLKALKRIYEPLELFEEKGAFVGKKIMEEVLERTPASLDTALKKILSTVSSAQTTSSSNQVH